MDRRNLWPGIPSSEYNCFPPSQYAPAPFFPRCPPQQFVTGPPAFLNQQRNDRYFPGSQQDRKWTPPRRFAIPQAWHGQQAVHFTHYLPPEVHRTRHHPLPSRNFHPPDHHFTSIVHRIQQSASPKVQSDYSLHVSPAQHCGPTSKRQKRAEVGETEGETDVRPVHANSNSTCENPAPTWSFWEAQNCVFKPDAKEDPFKHSRSLRHQQPSNPRRKREDGDPDGDYSDTPLDDAESDDEESDSDWDEELAEGKAKRAERAYTELLPKVKQLVSDIGINEKWPHDREEKACMVCNVPTRLKGWKGLLQHAESFQKRKVVQHRAYFRVLSEILKQMEVGPAEEGKAVLIENSQATEEVIVWPPVVMIDNIKEEGYLDMCLLKLKPSDIQRSFQFSKKGCPGVGRIMVVFPATEVGLLNSKALVDNFAEPAARASNYVRLSEFPHDRLFPLSSPPHHGPVNATHVTDHQQDQQLTMAQQFKQQQHRLRVFLAQAADMQLMDPQRKLVKWSIENKREILKCILRKPKEEHELEKAKVKAKLVEVDHIEETHQQFKFRKAILSQQLKDAEMAVKLQKDREGQIAKHHAQQLQLMDKEFKEEVRRLEFERINREARIRQLLEGNERQLENERVERNKEVNFLLKHLEHVNQELRNHTAQTALEKERDISRKREEVWNEVKRREAKFNEEGRILERNILEKQESEKMKFLQDYNTIRQEFLDEWVAKQAILKEKAEKAKQEKARLTKSAEKTKEVATDGPSDNRQLARAECSICFEEFDENKTRALIEPCGHAKTCLPCAVKVFSQSRLCPICRVQMSGKPKQIPHKLFM